MSGRRAAAVDLGLGVAVVLIHKAAWRGWRQRPSHGDARLMAELAAPVVVAAVASALTHRTAVVDHFGLHPKRRDPLAALAIMVGAQVLGAALGALVPASAEEPPVTERGATPPRLYDVFAPASEELVFRGLILRGASNLVAAPVAVLLQGAVFGALHLTSDGDRGVLHAVQAGCVGVAAGTVTTQQRGRLLPGLMAHYAFNFLGPRLNELVERPRASRNLSHEREP